MTKKVLYCFSTLTLLKSGQYILQSVSEKKLYSEYHSHDFYEIVCIIRGECRHKVNGSVYLMSAGNIMMLMPGTYHAFVGQSDDIILLSLSIAAPEFIKAAELFELDFQLSASGDKVSQGFYRYIGNITRLQELSKACFNGKDNDCDYKLLLCTLLNFFVSNSVKNDEDLPDSLRIALDKIKEPENLKHGVEALIRLSNYSYPHLYRLIKKSTGKTPCRLIADIRLALTYNMVLYTDKTFSHITEDVGYKSVSYLNKLFITKYGQTPSQLRKKFKTAHLIHSNSQSGDTQP